jgi:hypothetical protein
MRSGRTDAAGRYELGTRVAGRYTVRVRPAGWTAAAGRDLWVQVGAFDLPAGHSEIELTLDAPDRRNG